MPQEREGFQDRLQETFRLESEEHIKTISAALIELESAATADRRRVIDAVSREAHSLKGSARVVGRRDIEVVCRSLEDCFAALGKGSVPFSAELFDVLHLATDTLMGLRGAAGRPPGSSARTSASSVASLLAAAACGAPFSVTPRPRARPTPTPTLPAGSSATLRIPASRLESVLLRTEELISARLGAQELARDLSAASESFGVWKGQWQRVMAVAARASARLKEVTAARPSSPANQYRRILEFLEWNRTFLESADVRITGLAAASQARARALDGMVRALLGDVKTTLMSSSSLLVEGFPVFVRELSRKEKKIARLEIRGEEIEIDRRILETLREPLLHLLRNCVAHGIEEPAARKRAGKPPGGTIVLTIARQGTGHAEIVVADDGAGIDFAAVRAAAERSGIPITREGTEPGDAALVSLLYQSGLSTRGAVTDISGRGLGLPIVREKVESIRGTMSVESRRGLGTTFRIVVPLTLADFRGVIARAGGRLFVLPLIDVERAIRIRREAVSLRDGGMAMTIDGSPLEAAHLADLLGLSGEPITPAADAYASVLVIQRGRARLALLVDEVLGEQEVLVKPLGRHLARVRNVAGATMLPSGEIVPVLHAPDLLRALTSARTAAKPGPSGRSGAARGRILVVEDSPSVRAMLRRTLEAAGYAVETAADGVEALSILEHGGFAGVVSDVDMPRMNGIVLTARIRADARLARLPVILLTALESTKQRERGDEAGASAYIVKSSSDQEDLLEALRGLTGNSAAPGEAREREMP